MKRIHVRVKGVGILLMHRHSAVSQAEQEQKGKKRKSGPPEGKLEAEQGAYRLDPVEGDPVWGDDAPDGYKGKPKAQLCLSAEHFLQSMVLAAGGYQIPGKGKATYRDPIKGNVYVEPEYLGLTNARGEKLHHYEIDARPARIQRARVIRHRPKLTDWVTEFDIVVTDEELVPVEVLNIVLVLAGQTKCVGDYRPRYGHFMVEEFKEVA